MRDGIENFPLWLNREVRQRQEKARRKKSPREKVPPFSGLSQRVVIVCYEMGAPYFKVRRGTRPRARGLWARGPWGERERERGSEGMGFHSTL